MTWLSRAWEWTKRNWKWLLFPIGILAFLLGRLTVRRQYKVVSSELAGAGRVREDAHTISLQKNEEAARERVVRISEVEAEHAKTLKALTDEQRAKAAGLQEDPERLNQYLLQVGKGIQG